MTLLSSAFEWLGLGNPEPLSRFTYSPDLIGSLEDDHDELLSIYAEIESLAESGRYASIPAALQGFKSKFVMHVQSENQRFYAYVENGLAGDPRSLDTINAFRTDMNALARTVVAFVRKYDMTGVRPSNGQQFLVELREFGAALAARLESEEKDLYGLYQP